jgi:hypothetical protein
MAKMSKGENVSMEVIHKICEYLDVTLIDVVEFISTKKSSIHERSLRPFFGRKDSKKRFPRRANPNPDLQSHLSTNNKNLNQTKVRVFHKLSV